MKLKDFFCGLGTAIACGMIASFDFEVQAVHLGVKALAPGQIIADLKLATLWNSLCFYALALVLSVVWLQWWVVEYAARLDMAPRPERRRLLQAAEAHYRKGFFTGCQGIGWSSVALAIVHLFNASESLISFDAASRFLYYGLFLIGIGILAKVRGITACLMQQRPAALAALEETTARPELPIS